MTNIFEKASVLKLRFATAKGALATEDLWDLSLLSLDIVAKGINKSLKESEEESFIGESSPSDNMARLKLDIVKHVIAYKKEIKAKAASRVEKQAKIAELKSLYAAKSIEELKGLTKDELAKRIADLEQ